MKTSFVRTILFAITAIILMAIGIHLLGVRDSEAALGNLGTPVRCEVYVFIDEEESIYCTALDGTAFDVGYKVPSGYYFLVTDIIITADYRNDRADITLAVAEGGNVHIYDKLFFVQGVESYQIHYTMPYLILEAGQFLRAGNANDSTTNVTIYISGVLTTNALYLPLVTQ